MSLFNTNKTRISYISTETGEKVYPVLVDVKKGVQGGESIQFVSSDINTGILSVAFMLDNADYNVNGKDVVCTVQRPDTTTLELPCKHISNNVVEVHLGVNGTSQSGTYNFDFKIYRGNDEVVGTPILSYTVSQSIGNDMVVEDDDRLPILTELVSQLSTAKQQANTATNNTINAINNAVIATNNANSATTNANNAVVRAEETLANINNAIASGTQDLEVKEARDGEISLKARLDRDKEELDKIKKLEESTISTITTESDFTTVEETSNGYFEDVKLEGKTLVNLIEDIPFNYSATYPNRNFNNWKMLKPSAQYTFALLGDFTNAKNILISNSSITEVILPKNSYGQVFTFTTPSNLNEFTSLQRIYVYKESIDLTELQVAGWKLIILEGDHTNNPPSFFEGLMSVGQDVDEVSVESVNENLFDGNWMLGTINALTGVQEASTTSVCSDYIHIHPSETLVYYFDNQYYNGINAKVICFYDKDKNFLRGGNMSGIKNIPENTSYCRIRTRKDDSTDITQSDINNIGKCVLAYKDTNVSHQSDKKPLLYYNPTTQAWGKPILRQWDSIEKHSDGKYYYHKRSGEVVLNGSENWVLNNVDDNICRIRLQVNEIKPQGHIIANTLVTGTGQDSIYIHPSEKIIDIRLNVNKATNLEGAKQWLKANPTTVVYQLAQEEVYECTNIDLITYANETNYIVNCGAISPKTILKVHNNISNVVKILQEKVSLLENKFIEGLKQVLAGDMYSLAELLYPEDFKSENIVMTIPLD